MLRTNKQERYEKRIKDKEKNRKEKRIKHSKKIKKLKEQTEEQNKYKPEPKYSEKHVMKQYILDVLIKKENIQLIGDQGEFVDVLHSDLRYTKHGKERNIERQKQFQEFNGINSLKDPKSLKFMIKVIYNDHENGVQRRRLLITKSLFIVLKEFDNVVITTYPIKYGGTSFNLYYKRYNNYSKIIKMKYKESRKHDHDLPNYEDGWD